MACVVLPLPYMYTVSLEHVRERLHLLLEEQCRPGVDGVLEQREQYVNILKNMRKTAIFRPAALQEQTKAYLPGLLALMKAFEGDEKLVRFQLHTKWWSAIVPPSKSMFDGGHPPSDEVYVCSTPRCETMFVLINYAVALRGSAALEAAKTTAGDESANSREAVQLLRNAAAVFLYVREKHIPRVILPKNSPLDISPLVLNALEVLCLAEAQSIAASSSAELSDTVRIKLFLDTADRFRRVGELLEELPCDQDKLFRPLSKYIPVMDSICRATAAIMLAKERSSATKYGEAVAFARYAKSKTDGISQKGAKMCGKEVSSAAAAVAESASAVLAELERENDTVYYETEPDVRSLVFPEGRGIMTPGEMLSVDEISLDVQVREKAKDRWLSDDDGCTIL